MTTRIDFAIPGGARAIGELSTPPAEGPAPAVIVVHEWYGINDDIRRLTDLFAAEGFVALAVDLYGGRVAADDAEAARLSNEMQTSAAMGVIGGAVAYLKESGKTNGKVGITGFCLGGGMSLAAACTVSGIDAAVPFYGTPKDEFTDFAKAAPISGHYAKNDGYVRLDRVQMLKAKADAAGASFELFVYDAGHAFMRASDPKAHDEAAARLAWPRAVAFLKAKLG